MVLIVAALLCLIARITVSVFAFQRLQKNGGFGSTLSCSHLRCWYRTGWISNSLNIAIVFSHCRAPLPWIILHQHWIFKALTIAVSSATYEFLAFSVGRKLATPAFLVRGSYCFKCQTALTSILLSFGLARTCRASSHNGNDLLRCAAIAWN